MTIIAPHKIAIVLNTQIGEVIENLALNMYVWIVESPENKKALQKIPQADWYDSEHGVTFFEVDSKKFIEQQYLEIMSDIDEAHGANSPARTWSNLEVYGVTPTFLISEVLKSEYRVVHIEATAQGFIATRSID